MDQVTAHGDEAGPQANATNSAVASSNAVAVAPDMTVVHQENMQTPSVPLVWEMADSRRRVNIVILHMLA